MMHTTPVGGFRIRKIGRISNKPLSLDPLIEAWREQLAYHKGKDHVGIRKFIRRKLKELQA
jgi:hypothetical protein